MAPLCCDIEVLLHGWGYLRRYLILRHDMTRPEDWKIGVCVFHGWTVCDRKNSDRVWTQGGSPGTRSASYPANIPDATAIRIVSWRKLQDFEHKMAASQPFCQKPTHDHWWYWYCTAMMKDDERWWKHWHTTTPHRSTRILCLFFFRTQFCERGSITARNVSFAATIAWCSTAVASCTLMLCRLFPSVVWTSERRWDLLRNPACFVMVHAVGCEQTLDTGLRVMLSCFPRIEVLVLRRKCTKAWGSQWANK